MSHLPTFPRGNAVGGTVASRSTDTEGAWSARRVPRLLGRQVPRSGGPSLRRAWIDIQLGGLLALVLIAVGSPVPPMGVSRAARAAKGRGSISTRTAPKSAMWSGLSPSHANIDNPCDAARPCVNRFGIGGALMGGGAGRVRAT